MSDSNEKSRTFLDRFRLLSKLGEGSFGEIFKAIDIITNRLVAIKVETNKSTSQNQLKKEAQIYKEMEGTLITKNVRWPKLHFFGAIQNRCLSDIETDHRKIYDQNFQDKCNITTGNRINYIMVMDLLGPNFESILKKTPYNRLSPTSIAYLAEKMITLVERFHFNGFVHRDLKPQNFVIEYCEHHYPKYPEVYLIDYGLAKHYIERKKKTHIPFDQEKSLKGTVRYSSVNTHLGINQSRRDDMQSLGYILLYMLLGKLPWQNLMKNRDKKEAYYHIMILKMRTTAEQLTNDLNGDIHDAMLSYLLYVNSLMYDEQPNYGYCRTLFTKIASQFTGNIFKGMNRIL
jgi:serine/threonine protein kinase